MRDTTKDECIEIGLKMPRASCSLMRPLPSRLRNCHDSIDERRQMVSHSSHWRRYRMARSPGYPTLDHFANHRTYFSNPNWTSNHHDLQEPATSNHWDNKNSFAELCYVLVARERDHLVSRRIGERLSPEPLAFLYRTPEISFAASFFIQ